MFDGLIIWLGYVISGAFGLTLACGLLLAGGRRWGPPKIRAHLQSAPYGCALPVLFVLLILIGVGWALRPVEQPASLRLVRAIEVPIGSDADRKDLRTIMMDHGVKSGLRFVDTSASWQAAPPESKKTLYFALDRPVNQRDEWEVIASDDGAGTQPWVVFFYGVDPASAKRSRDVLLSKLRERFPGALEVPIVHGSGLPLRQDLIRTSRGYEIQPARAADYGLQKAQQPIPTTEPKPN